MHARVPVPKPALTLEEWRARGMSPNTWEKAVADQTDVSGPFGMLRQYSLLGVDAVDERRPTDQHQEDRD